MEKARLTAAALCGTMTISAVIMFLTPERKKKWMGYAVRTFFLLAVLVPTAEISADKIDSFTDMEAYEEALNNSAYSLEEAAQEQLRRCAEGILKKKAENILLENGVVPEKIELEIHIDGEGSISITSLKVQVSEAELDKTAEAAGELTRTFGVTVSLITAGE